MEIERNEEKKIISVWLTKAESQNQALQSRLKPMYAKWKKEKYLVAVYHSGKEDLYCSTLDLLAYSRVGGQGGEIPESTAPGTNAVVTRVSNAEEFWFFRVCTV